MLLRRVYPRVVVRYKSRFMPRTQDSSEQMYVLTLYTDKQLHNDLTKLREKYFPAKLNKLPAHLTLFHALPESKMDTVVSTVKEVVNKTKTFPLIVGPPFSMNHGIGINLHKSRGREEVQRVREMLLQAWRPQKFLSEQDAAKSSPHYTIMNKVDDPQEVEKAFDEVNHDWENKHGTAVGLALWRYQKGYWKAEKEYSFAS